MKKNRTLDTIRPFDAHPCDDGTWAMIFKVEPGSNLFGMGLKSCGTIGSPLPLVLDGREFIIGMPTARRVPIKDFDPSNGADAMQKIRKKEAFDKALGTWFIKVFAPEDQAKRIGAQVAFLQSRPKEVFDRMAALSVIEFNPTRADGLGSSIGDTVNLPAVPPEVFINEAGEDWRLAAGIDPAEDEAQSEAGDASLKLVFASLLADPAQTHKGVAIEVEDPRAPGQKALLGDLFAGLEAFNTFGFRLDCLNFTQVWILVKDGCFFPVKGRRRGSDFTVPDRNVQSLMEKAAKRPSPSPESALLYRVLKGGSSAQA